MGGTCKSTQKKTRENLLGAIKKRKIGLATVASTKKTILSPSIKATIGKIDNLFLFLVAFFFEGGKKMGAPFLGG